jgi:dihydropyrimidinase
LTALDLVLRNARAATAADVFDCDIGIAGGRIVALGQGLPAGAREIDAAGRVVTPGGVDAHCHLDQPMPPPVRMADDFDTGTRAAACGGTTTVIPFAAQEKGASRCAPRWTTTTAAPTAARIDYAFHLIVSDPTPEVLTRRAAGADREGYTSFKIYMTYDDLKLDDGRSSTCWRWRARTARWR